MEEKKSTCDYCRLLSPVLLCEADSAKLCLFCDRLVHSANALSNKHVRSQICSKCGERGAVSRCLVDDTVLCDGCDRDALSNSEGSLADRAQLGGFSGCPEPLELASMFGLDFNRGMEDTMLHVDFCDGEDSLIRVDNRGSSCLPCPAPNKHKQIVYQQLVQMVEEGLVRGLGPEPQLADCDFSPGASCSQQLSTISDVLDGMEGESLPTEDMAFSSLMTISGEMNSSENYGLGAAEGSSQGWGFSFDKQCDYEESLAPSVCYDANDANFIPGNYNFETSFTPTSIVEAMYDVTGCAIQNNCSLVKLPYNSCCSMNMSQPRSGFQAASNPSLNCFAEYGINILPSEVNGCNIAPDIGASPMLAGGELIKLSARADIDVLAQNRGHAMLRYREKRRNRRYDKHVRYESRKARADSRQRVKGRFVKST